MVSIHIWRFRHHGWRIHLQELVMICLYFFVVYFDFLREQNTGKPVLLVEGSYRIVGWDCSCHSFDR